MKYGAGILFYDNFNILVAKKETTQKKWDGIGGSSLPWEVEHKAFWETALRETLEELFGLAEAEIQILQNYLDSFLKNRARENVNVYVENNFTFYCFFLTFTDLIEFIADSIDYFEFSSPFYDKIPTSIENLVAERQIKEPQEIKVLDVIDMRTVCLFNSYATLLSDVVALSGFLEDRNSEWIQTGTW